MLPVPSVAAAKAYTLGRGGAPLGASGMAAAGLSGAVLPGAVLPGAAIPQPDSFAAFVEKSAAKALDTVRQGEAMAAAGLQGQASAQQVVQAVMSAELTVQAVVAVRDKMVNAYLDILRMPI